jgi:hypothetical protein
VAVEILEDSTQALVFVPPLAALPTAATVRIQTPSTGLPDASDNATIDSVSTTCSAASAGDTSLTVAGSTAFVAGSTYLIQPTDGAAFHVVCDKTATGTTLYIDNPLPCAIASGSAVKGCQASHALTAGETSEVGDGLAVWALTIGGVSYTYRQAFKIVRVHARYALSGAKLGVLSPLALVERPGSDDDLSESIKAAWDLHLAPSLKAKGVVLERVISAEELIPAHVAALDLHFAYTRKRSDQTAIDIAKARFNEALTLVLEGNETWIDVDDSLDASPADDGKPFSTSRWAL